MSTRNVVLTEGEEDLIEALVQSGRFESATDVVREGLRLIESRESSEAARVNALREALDAGISAIDRGDAKSFSSAAELTEHLKSVGAKIRSAPSTRRA